MGYGRQKIYTDATEITAENVVREVRKALLIHLENRADIEKLYGYLRGKTAILDKTKEVRANINHKINENRAYEIVSFYKGYTFGEPIQYVRRENATSKAKDDEIAADINALNGYMADAGKAACDNKLAEWMYTAGTTFRTTLPNPKWEKDGDEPPIRIFTTDPRNTFVVYNSGIDEQPVMAVHYVKQEDGNIVFSVYTDDYYFELTDYSDNVKKEPHALGMIPIIEYPADNSRLGVFEIVVPLLDALDELQSNRLDDVVQCVNSFLALLGGDMSEEVYKKVEEWKMLCLPEGTDAKYLSEPMRQSDIQTLKNDLYESILTICGIPNRNGGSSTSDTGSAVLMRDGWQSAEARAKATELIFKESEMQFLKLVLRILRDTVGTKLRLTDIEPHFTRRNYDNIQSKAQVLVSMLNNPKIHPELAFAHCGMFPDPESAYLQSKAWWEENERKQEQKEAEKLADTGDGAVSQVQQETDGSERSRAS